jgi:hypothetical protein
MPKNRNFLILLLLLVVGTVAYFSLENQNGHRGGVAELDGYYYYVYLRSMQMDGDLELGNEYRQWGNPFKFGTTPTGYHRNIFGIGPALLWSPFFVVTHVVALIGHKLGLVLTLDGMSRFHQAGTFYGTLIYAWLAVLLCYHIARRTAGRSVALWAALGAALAGPLPCYVLTWSSFSHAHAAFASSLMVLLWLRYRGNWTIRRWTIFGASVGLLVLVRPACFVFAALPLIEGAREVVAALRAGRHRDALAPLCGGGAALAVFSPQMIMWKLYYGSLIVTPQGEGFMWWSQSAWYSTLFSPRNGLFPWAPLMIVALVGLGIVTRRRPALGLPLWVIFIALVLVNGAVSDWWGWGFSARRYSAALPLFTLGLAVALRAIRQSLATRPRRTAAWITGLAILGAVVFNLQWMRNFSRHNMTWTGVHSTEGMYMTTTHSLVDQVYSVTGNPVSLPASLAFSIRRGGAPRIYDRIDGSYMLGESHLQANPSAKPYAHATLKMGDLRYRHNLSESFGNPKREGEVKYAPLREARGHVFLPINRPGDLQMMIGGRAVHAGTKVEILFNGERLGVQTLPAGSWTRLFATAPARLVARGINRLDLVHRLPPGWDDPGPRCVGRTGVCVRTDVAVVSGGKKWGNFTEIWIGGRKVSRNVRGLNVAVVAPDGELLGQRAFDTFAYPILYREFVRYLRTFPRGSVVALGHRDNPQRYFKYGGAAALAALGATSDLSTKSVRKAGYAAIGVIGAKPGTAQEALTLTGHARVRVGLAPPPWREVAHYRVIQVR